MTAKATGPFLSRDQFAMRNVERVALEFEILVARCAGRGYHGGSYAFVLAMAEHAGFCAEFGASLGKSWLKESMHGVGILIPRVTTGALFVSNGGVAECGVGGTQSEPVLNFGLELLAVSFQVHPCGSRCRQARHVQYWADLWHGNARLAGSPLWP